MPVSTASCCAKKRVETEQEAGGLSAVPCSIVSDVILSTPLVAGAGPGRDRRRSTWNAGGEDTQWAGLRPQPARHGGRAGGAGARRRGEATPAFRAAARGAAGPQVVAAAKALPVPPTAPGHEAPPEAQPQPRQRGHCGQGDDGVKGESQVGDSAGGVLLIAEPEALPEGGRRTRDRASRNWGPAEPAGRGNAGVSGEGRRRLGIAAVLHPPVREGE